MFVQTYKKYLFSQFLKKILSVSGVFFILVLILNLLEEVNFLKDNNDISFYTPLLLTFIQMPFFVITAKYLLSEVYLFFILR